MQDRDLVWQSAVVRGRAGRKWLEFADARGCARCDRGSGCGAAVFARLFTRSGAVLPCPDGAGPVGEAVTVGVPARWLVLAALKLYLLPVVGFVAGALLADLLWPARDAPALLAGLLGAAAGFCVPGSLRRARALPPLVIRESGPRLESRPVRMHLPTQRD